MGSKFDNRRLTSHPAELQDYINQSVRMTNNSRKHLDHQLGLNLDNNIEETETNPIGSGSIKSGEHQHISIKEGESSMDNINHSMFQNASKKTNLTRNHPMSPLHPLSIYTEEIYAK